MTLENILDGLHGSVIHRWWTQLFTAFVRVLLAVSFIPPSIPKILHQPFSILPETHPVGAYFWALYRTGFYYDFLGWTQLAAAVLLLIPRTAHIGALMFFPIIVNIAVLTWSVDFQGTWLITLLMAIAALYLVCWEYERLKPLIFRTRADRTIPVRHWWLAIPLFFTVGGFVLNLAFRYFMIGNLTDYLWAGIVISAIGLGFGIVVALHFRFMPAGRLLEKGPDV
jgi:hypothetical protein